MSNTKGIFQEKIKGFIPAEWLIVVLIFLVHIGLTSIFRTIGLIAVWVWIFVLLRPEGRKRIGVRMPNHWGWWVAGPLLGLGLIGVTAWVSSALWGWDEQNMLYDMTQGIHEWLGGGLPAWALFGLLFFGWLMESPFMEEPLFRENFFSLFCIMAPYLKEKKMNIGLQVPSFKYPGSTESIRPKLKEIVTTAEEAGFHSLWVMDHYYQIKGLFGEAYTDPMLESYTTLGYFAGLTEKAQLGVMVTGVIYRHPSVLMKMVNTLDILSGGRAYLGIGAAWYEEEAKGYGIDYPSTSERFEQLEDNLQLAKALWDGDVVSFKGQHFSAPAITNNPAPLSKPHPRILIGGMGPKKTLRMVAQYADACNFFEMAGMDKMQSAIDTLKAHCERLDRDYDTIEKTSLGTVHLSENDTVDSVIKRIKGLSEMGFTHTIFNMPDVYKVTPLETFAKEIIPAVAEL